LLSFSTQVTLAMPRILIGYKAIRWIYKILLSFSAPNSSLYKLDYIQTTMLLLSSILTLQKKHVNFFNKIYSIIHRLFFTCKIL
jgi:hypothetical protein